jgi:hypothetical protein
MMGEVVSMDDKELIRRIMEGVACFGGGEEWEGGQYERRHRKAGKGTTYRLCGKAGRPFGAY